ncbi:MAG: hypothetical protein OGM16_12165 [Lachnospiraceae bacterium]|nr:MAG: hypothetical protein OGM16_12165 [Lachnospiraceae bacterium]
MFKNISALEKSMRSILTTLNESGSVPYIENNQDLAYSLFCCCEKKYILNLEYGQNANRDYIFQATGNVRVSKKGLEFIKETSFSHLFLRNLFSFLHGAFGFLLGIVSALIIAFLTRHFGLT